jgi:hypothetical protein
MGGNNTYKESPDSVDNDIYLKLDLSRGSLLRINTHTILFLVIYSWSFILMEISQFGCD